MKRIRLGLLFPIALMVLAGIALGMTLRVNFIDPNPLPTDYYLLVLNGTPGPTISLSVVSPGPTPGTLQTDLNVLPNSVVQMEACANTRGCSDASNAVTAPPSTATAIPTFTRTATFTPTPSITSTPTFTPTLGRPTPPILARIEGAIETFFAAPVSAVTIDSVVTDPNGVYKVDVPTNSAISLVPSKQGGRNSAITSIDAVWILQSIVDNRSLSAAQRIAADVNGDGVVSSLDAVSILQYCAGLITQFPISKACGSDWAFVPNPDAAFNQIVTPPMIRNGQCVPGSITFNPIIANETGQNFTAILFGDVNGSWTPS